MDVERSLLSRCVRDGKMEVVVSRGIEVEHFVSRAVGTEPATADVWEWLLLHKRHYHFAPSEDLFRRRWPGFVLLDGPDPLDAVLDEFVRVLKRRKLIDQIRHLSTIADDWNLVGDAEIHVMEAARELARLVPTTAAERFSDSFDRMEAHRKRQETGQTSGVSFLIPEIDDFTYGVQRNEMAVIEGSTSIGKSSMAVAMAARAYFTRDESPLFISLEMEGEKLANRWDSFASGISYSALKRHQLGDGDYERWGQIAERAAESRMEKDIIVIDDLFRPSIERVVAEVERWRPSFVVVDPIDEISAPSQYRSLYERQGYAARELKGIARAFKVPFIVMAQAGRDAEHEGATLGNIAGSFDIARKADIVVGLHASEQMQRQQKLEIRLLKNRDDPGKGFSTQYHWNPATMEYRPWRPEDAVPEREPTPA